MTDLELEALLRNARSVAPHPDVKGRLRTRVLSAAAVGGALASGTAHAAAATASSGATLATASTPLVWSAVYALAAGAVIGGLVSAPLALRAPASVSPSQVKRQAEPRTSPRGPSDTALPPAETVLLPAAPVSSLSDSKPLSAPRATPSNHVAPSIQRETLLLSEAQRALQQGNARHALVWLNRYDAEFPRGALAEEALAARRVTWCSLGHKDLAEQALRTFEQSYPRSPLLPRLKAACKNLERP